MTDAPLTLVSHALCPYVQRAAIVLDEKGVPFARRTIDLAAKPAWFAAVSPLGKVPVLLLPDGRALFESAPICEYLDETTPGRMLPEDPVARARHRAWIAFASATLDGVAAFYTAPDAAAFEAARARLVDRFAQLDRELDGGGGPYFAGESFGQVDAAFAPLFRYLDTFDGIADFGLLRGCSAVAAYRAVLAARTSVQEAVTPDYPALLRAFLRRREGYLAGLMAAPASGAAGA